MVKADLKRIIKYILITAIISAVLLNQGIEAAYRERGYQAVGGEYALPIYVVSVAAVIYNRKRTTQSSEEKEDEKNFDSILQSPKVIAALSREADRQRRNG